MIQMQIKEALKDAKPQPLWHDPSIMPTPQPSLKGDVNCELLIVGGGFTGLWAALQLKERKPDADVVLIDQTFVGDGASGRCGGFLNASLAHGETNTDAHFPGEADRLEELGDQNIKEFLETLERYNIDARYEQTGATDVALNPTAAAKLRKEYEQQKAEGLDSVWLDQDTVREQINSPTMYAGLWYRDGQDGVIDPGRLCWGLKEVLLNLGVRIFENTRLSSVKPVGNDGMLAICEDGQISSSKVLMATNAYTSSISKINRAMIPVWDFQIATEPLTDEQLEKIGWGTPKSRHALSDYNNMFHYFRLTKDNRITYGGGGAVRYFFNRGIDPKYGDQPERFEQLAKEFFETFPQLSDVKFSNKWGGIIATSTRFCMVPGTAHEGRLAWTVGYTGHGVGASRYGARVGIELLGYKPTDILKMKFVTSKPMPWVPEPFRWVGVRLTQLALLKADRNGGKRGLWLTFLDKLGLGFTC